MAEAVSPRTHVGSLMRDHLPVVLMLAIVAVVLYAGVLDAPFVFDDVTIRDRAWLHADEVSEAFAVLVDEDSDRRVGYFTFALNYYFGGLETFGYRLVNLIIHVLNGWLVFWLVYRTLLVHRGRTSMVEPAAAGEAQIGSSRVGPSERGASAAAPPSRRSLDVAASSDASGRAAQPAGLDTDDPARERAWTIAVFGALVWLAHPVQIMAVTYIVQRLTSLSTLLYLAAFALYVEGRLRRGRGRQLLWAGALATALVALGVKQNVALLPAMVLLYDLTFFHGAPWGALRRRWPAAVAVLLAIALITLAYLGPGFWSVIQQRYAGRDFTMGERLLSEARVLAHYVSLLALPLPSRLVVDYDFPVSRSLLEPPTTLPAVLLVLGALAFALAGLGRRPLLCFSILWFLVNLAVESTIIPVDLAFEHRLYLPSMAPLALAAGALHDRLATLHRVAAPVALAAVVFLLGVATHERNEVWTDPVLLWSDNAAKAPGKARVHGNLGKALLDAGRHQEAAVEFERALAIDPTLLGAYNNLAVIYIDHLQDYERARSVLEEAIRLDPDYPGSYLNLGVIELNTRDPQAAIRNFEKVLDLAPDDLMAHYNLAASHINLGELERAVEVLDRGLSFWPSAHRLYLLKGRALMRAGDTEAARAALERARQLQPDDPEVGFYLGQLRQD